MGKIKDWSLVLGKKFNNLTVVKEVPRISSNLARFLCKCDCGKECEVNYSKLASNSVKSCGCLVKLINKGKERPKKSKGYGVRSFNALYLTYQTSAKKRGLVFDINKEDFKKITSSNCAYCGKIPSTTMNINVIKYGNYVYNGIDRIDNNLGYTNENVLPCCKNCNYMKKELSINEFKAHIKNIYFYLINNC